MRLLVNAFTPAAASSSTWLLPRGQRARLDSDKCALRLVLVEPYISLCFKHSWHRFVGCRSRLFLVNLVFALGV